MREENSFKLFSNIETCYLHFKILIAVHANANGYMNLV